MSHPLVSRSPDLQRLRDEGLYVDVQSNYLVVRDVPFVTASRTVERGTLVSELATNGATAIAPGRHTVWFVGGIPCDKSGAVLTNIIADQNAVLLAEGLPAACQLSAKPLGQSNYVNYYEKMTAYVELISGWAQAIDSTATAKTFHVIETTEDESVFRYLDSASSRAGISVIAEKLALSKVAIVGLGGTGSFILDLIAKTPITEIHLFDADTFYVHNAFRAPGAASVDDLTATPTKVDYYGQMYGDMRRGIIAHPVFIDETNVRELQAMTFVFLSMVAGSNKKFIIEELERFDIPFIDCGIGVHRLKSKDELGGIVSVTASTPGHRSHVRDNQRISFADEEDDEYDRNIQIADLNALNAVLAVIKWKKLFGFYCDLDRELYMAYTIDGNHLVNADHIE